MSKNKYYRKFLRSIQLLKYRILVLHSISFIIGCLVWSNAILGLLVFFAWIILLSKARILNQILFAICFLLFGFFYTQLNFDTWGRNANSNIDASGTIFEVITTPKVYEYSQKVRLKAKDIPLIEVNLPKYPTLNQGDAIKLINPKLSNIFETNKPYLKSYGIYLTGSAEFEKIQTNTISQLFGGIRARIIDAINYQSFPPESTLINGVLLGDSDFDIDTAESIKKAGLSHIVAVSGYNFNIIFTALLSIPPIINRRRLSIAAFLAILIYLLIVGVYNISALRAMIMISLSLTSSILGRRIAILDNIVLTATILLLINPFYLSNVSFLLSFCATIAIIIGGKLEIVTKNKIKKYFLNTILASLLINILTLPVIFIAFGNVYIMSIISNFVVLPTIPYLMLFGAASIPLNLLSLNQIEIVFKRIAEIIAAITIQTSQLIANISPAINTIYGFILIMFLNLFVVLLILRSKKETND